MLQKIVSGARSTPQGNSIDYIMSLPNTLPKSPNENNEQSNGTVWNDESGSSSQGSNYQRHNSMSTGFSSNVGISTNSLDSSSDSGEDGASSGKSYEVSKSTTKKLDSNNIIYAIVLIIIIGAIAGYGFMRNRKEN